MTSPPPPSSSELVPPRTVCWAPSCNLCSHTVWLLTIMAVILWSLQRTQTQQWSDASSTVMSLTTGRRWCRENKLHPDFLQQVCGRECPVLLHLCVAWQLLCGREKGSGEGVEGRTEDCGKQLAQHRGHLLLYMQERASNLKRDLTHTLQPPPLRKRLQSIKSGTTRLSNNFHRDADRLFKSGGAL